MADLKTRIQKALARGDRNLAPIISTLGFWATRMEDGEAVVEMEVGESFLNPMGTVHGGILATVADSAMGLAFISTLDEGDSFTTVDITMKYMRPVFPTKLTAQGRVVKRGRVMGLCQCEVMDADGNLVAVGYSSCMALKGAIAQGR